MALAVSVVIPVYNAADTLEKCLTMLELSLEQPAECIVVDDGSTDSSAQIALRHKAKLLSTNGRCGPATARNIGAQAATSPILLFLDADVLVNPETIAKIVAEFAADPDLDSVMGSYDNKPPAPNFVSQYRNLMHCFVHQNSNPAASTFWAGCGAIRRDVFLEFGGFNEMYRTPAIEDIELGYRMSRDGRKLALGADIQVKHLKRWSLRSMMKTDFFLRALPWADLTILNALLSWSISKNPRQQGSKRNPTLPPSRAKGRRTRWRGSSGRPETCFERGADRCRSSTACSTSSSR